MCFSYLPLYCYLTQNPSMALDLLPNEWDDGELETDVEATVLFFPFSLPSHLVPWPRRKAACVFMIFWWVWCFLLLLPDYTNIFIFLSFLLLRLFVGFSIGYSGSNLIKGCLTFLSNLSSSIAILGDILKSLCIYTQVKKSAAKHSRTYQQKQSRLKGGLTYLELNKYMSDDTSCSLDCSFPHHTPTLCPTIDST